MLSYCRLPKFCSKLSFPTKLSNFLQQWVGYISSGYISGIYIQMLDIWYWYISIWNTGYVDISANGSGFRIFLLHKISFLATGYRIWIYIHLKSVDLDMILYPKKVDMTHSWIFPICSTLGQGAVPPFCSLFTCSRLPENAGLEWYCCRQPVPWGHLSGCILSTSRCWSF